MHKQLRLFGFQLLVQCSLISAPGCMPAFCHQMHFAAGQGSSYHASSHSGGYAHHNGNASNWHSQQTYTESASGLYVPTNLSATQSSGFWSGQGTSSSGNSYHHWSLTGNDNQSGSSNQHHTWWASSHSSQLTGSTGLPGVAGGLTASGSTAYNAKAGTSSTTAVPATSAQALSQMNAVVSGDWASWTGGSNSPLTVSEVGQLLLNPNVTGSQAGVLGMIADLMNIAISSNSNPNFSPTYSLVQIQGFLSANPSYYSGVMSQIASSTKSNGSFSLYGSYSAPQLASIQQAAVGDCYLVSALEGVLNQNPQLVSNMITQNANGTFTVSFPSGSKESVTLTDGEIAQFSMAVNNGCWLTVMGMAEAQVLTTTPAYAYTAAEKATPLGIVVNGGYQTQTLSMLTGQAYSSVSSYTPAYYNVKFVDQLLTTDMTTKTPLGVDSIDHALDIIGFNSTTQVVTILNPWGTSGAYNPEPYSPVTVQMVNGVFTLTTAQMLSDFVSVQASNNLLTQSVAAMSGSTHGVASGISAILSPVSGSGISASQIASLNLGSSILLSYNGSLPALQVSSIALPLQSSIAQSNLISSALVQSLPASASLDVNTSGDNGGNASVAGDSDFMPVSMLNVAAANICDRLPTFPAGAVKPQLSDDSKTANQNLGSAATCNRPVYQAGQGSLLVMRDRPVEISTSRAQVYVAAGAAVYIVQIGDDVAVHNLADRSSRDVQVKIGGKTKTVPMGKALLLTANSASTAQPACLTVEPKNMQSLGSWGDSAAFVGNVAYAQAFKVAPQFRQLMHSNLPGDRKIAQKLLKAGAAVATLFPAH